MRDGRGRLFMIGVGGSAANASHAVNDFRKLCGIETYTPADNVSELTARTNDEGWETTFEAWLRTSNLCERDAVFVLSVGGGDAERGVSVNLIRAIDLAKERGAAVLGIVGRDGGHTARVGDAVAIVPTVDAALVTPIAESFQSVILHGSCRTRCSRRARRSGRGSCRRPSHPRERTDAHDRRPVDRAVRRRRGPPGLGKLAALPYIAGFTTNPTLMRKAGIVDYVAFARDVVDIAGDRPISFEVFSDDFAEMDRAGPEIASWGPNVFVKIPVTNTTGRSSAAADPRLVQRRRPAQRHGDLTVSQVEDVVAAL